MGMGRLWVGMIRNVLISFLRVNYIRKVRLSIFDQAANDTLLPPHNHQMKYIILCPIWNDTTFHSNSYYTFIFHSQKYNDRQDRVDIK